MRKNILMILSVIMLIGLLAACNTTEERARESQRNNLNQVTFDPEDENMQQEQRYAVDPRSNEQSRFDANVYFEGINPNGPNGTMEGPYFFDQEGRYDQRQAAPSGDNQGQPESAERNNKQAEKDTTPNESQTASGDFQKKVIELTNEARKKNGLKPLKNSAEVEEVAQVKSEDMAENDYFSHTSPTYGSPFDMLEDFDVDYSTAAENIAAGQQSPKSVVDGWLNSSGHRKNIMNNSITHIGVGYAKDGNYWVQMFIAK
ncbi:hypothetical protein GLW04_11140 [Halobacillus litoralis]|uniref:SCP domain-containing protein n=1 Tax=Halobacillus litoralis TaxID=45668 RepID=A0A845E2D7_9BACI|nr:CAP domain-containing protein [Halobacillus litoralis]MYL20447.1 hypothetical protein [Halobacillus litoralis]